MINIRNKILNFILTLTFIVCSIFYLHIFFRQQTLLLSKDEYIKILQQRKQQAENTICDFQNEKILI